MEKSIFEFVNYKQYLENKIVHSPSKGRGIKLKMALFLNCQNTFISQVLKGSPHFSSEQAIKLNQFFEHTKEESKFFILLINYARAGSHDLQVFYKEEIDEMVLKNSDLKKRTNIKNTLKEKDQDTYYSTWLYSAIHILVTIKEFQNVSSISRRLNLSKDKTIEILDFLVERGIIEKQGNIYTSGPTRLHLANNSVHIQRHHTNWRLQAIKAIDLNLATNVHFSNVVSIADKDIPRVREIFTKAIAEARLLIKDSPEEKLRSICVDFFEV